jgi:hypothetical protein
MVPFCAEITPVNAAAVAMRAACRRLIFFHARMPALRLYLRYRIITGVIPPFEKKPRTGGSSATRSSATRTGKIANVVALPMAC